MSIAQAYNLLYTFCLIALSVLVLFCFVRSVKGPGIADRMVAVNMIGTITIIIVSILALMLGENYLVDIAIIYAMISFLAVVVVTKIYIGVYLEKHQKGGDDENA